MASICCWPFCAGCQDRTLHPRHGLRSYCEEAGDKAEGALRQVCGHGHPGADQHCAPVLQQGNLVPRWAFIGSRSVGWKWGTKCLHLFFVEMTAYVLWCVFSWNASPGCARKPRGSWPLTSETGRIGPRTRCVCYYCARFLPRKSSAWHCWKVIYTHINGRAELICDTRNDKYYRNATEMIVLLLSFMLMER